MTREHLLIGFGLLVAVSPFIGIPLSWLSMLLPVAGVLVTLLSVTLLMRRRRHEETMYEASHTSTS